VLGGGNANDADSAMSTLMSTASALVRGAPSWPLSDGEEREGATVDRSGADRPLKCLGV
jgi:hypothetical protein